MMPTVFYKLILLSFSILLSSVECRFQLELVQILFRHGDRTPRNVDTILIDNKNESLFEPWGYGQLTNKGRMREYRIGQMLRHRYRDFLYNYRSKDVYAYSSNFDRTKNSLQLMLAGLFPPTNETSWNEYLHWLPIPIYTLPTKLDVLFFSDACPEYEREQEEIQRLPAVVERFAKYKDFFKFITEKTGEPSYDIRSIVHVYSTLASYRSMGVRWPSWVTPKVFRTIEELVELYFEHRSYTTTSKRIYGGTLIRRFLENLSTPRKIYLYSAHDTNVASFIKAHNLAYPRIPDFGTAVIMEKITDEKKNIYIKLLLWDGSINKLSDIKLENCEILCPLNDYMESVASVFPSNEEMRCLVDNMSGNALAEIVNNDLFHE